MPGTVYTFHRAADHQIIDTAEPSTLQTTAAHIAARIHRGLPDADLKTTRVYVHNGLGIVSAGLCRQGTWHDVPRDDWHQFDGIAREVRAAAGWPNDPTPRGLKQPRSFAVEYRSPTGRIQTHRTSARNADDAKERTVEALGIDFGAIQSTEERGA